MRTSRLISLSTLAAVVAAIAVAPGAQAADDYFLKIDGVPGQAAAGAATDAIQINAFEWGAETTSTIGSATNGTGGGKAAMKELTIEKFVDSTTPVLFQKLGQGSSLGSIELVARRVGGGAAPIYMRYCMQPAFVVSQTQNGSAGEEGIKETVVIKFGAVSQTYAQNTNGKISNVFGSWNTLTNTTSMALPNSSNNPCATSRF